MKDILFVCLGILIPFIGTSFGSAFVFFLKKEMNEKIKKVIVGFASGVMIAASVWSLILPSVEMALETYQFPWFPAAFGLILGVAFLIFVNHVASCWASEKNQKKLNMLSFSVTLHNIPEGMAVGVCFAGFLSGSSGILLIEAMVLAIGIAIQNIPEGAIISMPLKMEGKKKGQAFLAGVFSGIVEPIAAFLTLLFINFVVPVLPYLLTFAAGAMIYVVVEELIPEIHENQKSILGIIGVTFGFVLMMVLDIALG